MFGSRFGGRGLDVDVVGRASSCSWMLVVKPEEEHKVIWCRLTVFRRQCNAGRMVYIGVAIFNGCLDSETVMCTSSDYITFTLP